MPDFQIYLTSKGSSVTNLILCHGSVIEQNNEDEFFLILFNKQFYFLFSNVFLIFISIIMKYFKLRPKEYFYNLLIFFIFINLIFNFPIGFNFFNELFINQLVVLVILLIPFKQNET